MSKTVKELILEYFDRHPSKPVKQGDIAVWVMKEYEKEHGKPCLDPWRGVRRLYQEGVLMKLAKGIYRYEPKLTQKKQLPDFPSEAKEQILKRDNYKCVVCGRGIKDGVEICADHIIPIDSGGTNTVENGQTLCSEHNILKKNYSQTEAAKRYFIKLYEQAIGKNDEKMIDFCQQVFNVYNRHKVNTHIPRPDKSTRGENNA